MIIVDFSQVFLSNLLVQAKNYADQVEEGLVRHMVLNSLRLYNKRFKHKYGQMVIACDGQNYWRKDLFPQYKAHRKKDKKKSSLDWNKIYEVLDKVRNEIEESFPYPVIRLDKIEADDVIATIVEQNRDEDILILSGDHDFNQLQKYDNVSQFDPRKKKFINTKDPKRNLYEHIIRGDKGDGIPNIFSDDDTFVKGNRSKPIYTNKLNSWLDTKELYDNPEELFNSDAVRNFHRNQQLIDLSKIPCEHKEKIKKEFINKMKNKNSKNQIMKYMQKHKLRNLIKHLSDF